MSVAPAAARTAAVPRGRAGAAADHRRGVRPPRGRALHRPAGDGHPAPARASACRPGARCWTTASARAASSGCSPRPRPLALLRGSRLRAADRCRRHRAGRAGPPAGAVLRRGGRRGRPARGHRPVSSPCRAADRARRQSTISHEVALVTRASVPRARPRRAAPARRAAGRRPRRACGSVPGSERRGAGPLPARATTSAGSTGTSPPGPGEPHVWRTAGRHRLDTWLLLDQTPSMAFGTVDGGEGASWPPPWPAPSAC